MSRSFLLGCSAAVALASSAVDAATIRGRIVDATHRAALPGATVTLPNGAATVTKPDGSFVFDDVPAGAQHVTVHYAGFPDTAADVVAGDDAATAEIVLTPEAAHDEIVVNGTRLAEARALQTKRSADNIVEALYANDVGKLPDQNVAEAVKRLPGVTVANDQGEGRYVVIRGINPNLVNVLLNAQTLPAPEPDGRQVKLDDIPSAMIGSVVVTKSLTPDLDANAIGGQVDIRTLSAFDRNRKTFADARLAYGSYKLNHKHPYEGDAQVGDLFGADGQFGAVLSVNYSKRPIESENFQGTTTFNKLDQPDQFGLRDYNLVRTRLGAVGNFDWHPNDAVKIFVRTSYSRFSDNEIRDQNRVDSLAFGTGGTTFTGRGSILIRRRIEKDNTKSGELGGAFDLPAGHLDVSGTYTRAIKNDPLRSEYNFRTSSTTAISGTDTLSGPIEQFGFTPFNPAAFPLNTVNYDKRHAQEDLWQLRADYTLPVPIGDGSTIKAGGKYLDRHKTNNRDYLQYGLAKGASFTAATSSYVGDTDFYDGLYTFGPRVDYDVAQAYVAAHPGVLTQSASNLTSSRSNSLANDYDVRERIAAGYAMATLKFDALTVLPGVRVEHTQDSNKAKLITATSTVNDDFNSFGGRSYTNWFPGINAHYDIGRHTILRAGLTTAIGRPNYPDLAPYVSVDTTTSPRSTVTLGNPDLKPYRAWSADLAAEYYLPGQGLISVGLFYKHLDDPIYTQSILNTSGTFAGQSFAAVDVVQPLNIDHAFVRGVEANAQTRFTFLPAPFDGLGVSVNFTHVSGHASGTIQGAIPRNGDIPLLLQSKDSGTAQLFYEKYGFALRVAFTYRSAYLDTLGTSAALDQYTGPNGQLDANLSYQVAPQLTFFGSATNITDAPWRRYLGSKAFLIERERYDYSVRWGAQLHF